MKERSISWKQRITMLLVIMGVIIAIDLYFGGHLVGAAMRFLWNGIVFTLLWLERTIRALPLLLGRRRVMQVTTFITGIGLGYASSVILNDKQLHKVHTGREKVRARLTGIRNWWLRLSNAGKFGVVGLLILAQIFLMPAIAEWIVLFPIAFMVPVLLALRQWIVSFLADSLVGKLYWRYCGAMHKKAVEKAKRVPLTRMIRDAILLKRLQYLTAWRMWKHAECYRAAKGRRRISLFEPVRLWWRNELNVYVGRPLLSGKCAPWPVRTYLPPKLWYERDPMTRLVITFAVVFLTTTLRSSVRRR